MATYGQGQMLGAGIDPRMFVQDYSGFARAGAIQGEGYANLGQQIGQAAKDYGDQQKERKKLDADTKANSTAIESAIKLGDQLGINLKDVLAPISQKINDPNTTPLEANALSRAAAQQISSAFTLGIQAKQYEGEMALKRAELGLRAGQLNAPEPENWKPYDLETSYNGQQYKIPAFVNNRGQIKRGGVVYESPADALIGNPQVGVSRIDQYGDSSLQNLPEGMKTPADYIGQAITLTGPLPADSGGGASNALFIEPPPEPQPPSSTINPFYDAWNARGQNIQAAQQPRQPSPEVIQNIEKAGSPSAQIPPDAVPIIGKKPQQGAVMTAAQIQEEMEKGREIDAVPIGDGSGNYLVTKIKAGGTPLVQVNTEKKRENKYEDMISTSLAKTKEEASASASQIPKIDELSNLIEEGVKTGFGQDVFMKARKAFGVDVSDEETFKKVSGDIAMGYINLTKGAISDREMDYFKTELAPNIGTTEEGNKKIIAFMRGASEKAARIDKIITDGMRQNKSPFDIDKEVQSVRLESSLIQRSTSSGITDPEIEQYRKSLGL